MSSGKSSSLFVKMHVRFCWVLLTCAALKSLEHQFLFSTTGLLTKSGELLRVQGKVCTTIFWISTATIKSTTTESTTTSSSATSATATSSFTSSTTAASTASPWFTVAFEIYLDVDCLLDTARCLNFFLYDLKMDEKWKKKLLICQG